MEEEKAKGTDNKILEMLESINRRLDTIEEKFSKDREISNNNFQQIQHSLMIIKISEECQADDDFLPEEDFYALGEKDEHGKPKKLSFLRSENWWHGKCPELEHWDDGKRYTRRDRWGTIIDENGQPHAPSNIAFSNS